MEARRELQLASIPDIQGSIQANDSKSSAALVVHGLLFAGLLSVLGNSGEVWDDARDWVRLAGILLLVAVAACFVRSVFRLIAAVEPSDPESTRKAIGPRYTSAFFPPADPDKTPPAGRLGFDVQLWRLSRLNTDDDFEREYAAEQVKLADIRVIQAAAAKAGFRWLRIEIILAGVLLALIAAVAAGAPGVARGDSPRELELTWRVIDGGRETRLRGSGSTTARAGGLVRIRLVARGTSIERASIAGTLAAGCTGSRRPPVLEPVAAEEEDAGDDTVLEYTATHTCPRGQRPYVAGFVRGHARARDATSSAQLTLRQP